MWHVLTVFETKKHLETFIGELPWMPEREQIRRFLYYNTHMAWPLRKNCSQFLRKFKIKLLDPGALLVKNKYSKWCCLVSTYIIVSISTYWIKNGLRWDVAYLKFSMCASSKDNNGGAEGIRCHRPIVILMGILLAKDPS